MVRFVMVNQVPPTTRAAIIACIYSLGSVVAGRILRLVACLLAARAHTASRTYMSFIFVSEHGRNFGFGFGFGHVIIIMSW